jgi:D-aspartate ligase
MKNLRPPAVVVGAASCGLGLVRSLGRANVPVIVVDKNPIEPAMHSRFGRGFVVSALSGRSLVNDLLGLSGSLNGPAVLFPTTDEMVLTISEFRSSLDKAYRFSLPTHQRLLTLTSKTGFQNFAQSNGFHIPRSVTIEEGVSLDGLSKLTFPCIVKPAIKNVAYRDGHFERAYKVTTQTQAAAVCRLLLSVVPSVVVQEWIEGPDSEIFFCLQYRASDGRTISSFTGRKLSIWPPDVGVTASCTAAPEVDSILRPLTETFFKTASLIGLGGMEFKRDTKTGQFLMIEPTVGRADLQEEIATLHGTNIPLAAYSHEVGLQMPASGERRVPRIWQGSWTHGRSAYRHHAELNGKRYDAYWRLYDPMPALFHAGLLIWSIAIDTIKRVQLIYNKRFKPRATSPQASQF